MQISSDGANRSAEALGGFRAVTARTHDAAEELQQSSDDLAQQASKIRSEVAAFCEKVAAA